jgi:uncharacterized protein YkwD
MANALPILLIGAAVLLMRKKGNGGSSGGDEGRAGGAGESDAAGSAEEHKPNKEPWKEGDPIPDDWIPVPNLGDGPQKYIKPPVQMTLFIPTVDNEAQFDPIDEPEPSQPEPEPSQPEPEPQQPSADVPSGAYCSDVADWNPQWVALEEEMLAAINAVRAQGYNCSSGQQAAAPPLTMNPHLRCSSRKHSMDMGKKNYFSHTNQEGEESWDRIWEAGFAGNITSENITAGPPTVQQAMQNFLTSTQGHCEALFDPQITEVGIGYYQQGGGYQFYWTQNFGGSS